MQVLHHFRPLECPPCIHSLNKVKKNIKENNSGERPREGIDCPLLSIERQAILTDLEKVLSINLMEKFQSWHFELSLNMNTSESSL